MKNPRIWLLIFGIVFILIIIGTLLFFFTQGYGWMPMMGYGEFSSNGVGIIGGLIMMGAMLLIPAILIGLVIFGFVALIQRSGNSQIKTPLNKCPNCGKVVQDDWNICPNCGTKLK